MVLKPPAAIRSFAYVISCLKSARLLVTADNVTKCAVVADDTILASVVLPVPPF